jgi:hypothetical protein
VVGLGAGPGHPRGGHHPGDLQERAPTRLRISNKTVRNHVSNIFTNLAVADRAQTIVRAL